MNAATPFKKSALHSAILVALSINGAAMTLSDGTAQASNQTCADTSASTLTTASGNFTMLGAKAAPGTVNSVGASVPGGNTVGGTNDVTMTWDGSAFTSSSDYTGPTTGGNPLVGATTVSNVTASSPTAFFGATWTAHDIQLFAPGSYQFDTSLGAGNPESGMMNVSVGNGQVGLHMLFDWNGNNNIDVFIVANLSTAFGPGFARSADIANCDQTPSATAPRANCLWDGAKVGPDGKPAGSKVWMLSSSDGNSDGIMGIPMAAGGPFAGFNANFNMPGTLVLVSGSSCAPAAQPNQFTFNDVTGATPNTLYTSNTITVSGLGSGVSAAMTIAGGQYSTDGGTSWSSADTTAQDGDTIEVRQTSAANADGTTTDTILSIGGVSDTYSVTVIDKKPAAFTLTSQNGVATSTLIESNTITVSGMDSGLTTPINVTGGEYSKNGGAYTSAAGTVTLGDTVKVRQLSSSSASTTTIATLSLGQSSDGTLVSGDFNVRTAGGYSSTGNNFTMLGLTNNIVGGTNDVVMTWDQQFNTGTSDPVTPATAHMQLSSTTPFFGNNWTAHHIRVFGPGTYVINVDCDTAQIEAGTCGTNPNPARNYTFVVGANQIGAHMLFDWNGTYNIDVVDVWDKTAVFSPSELFTGAGGFNAASTVWDLMSGDANATCPGAVDATGAPINCTPNGINGIPMIDGPFKGFSANFNIKYVGTTAPSNYTPTVNIADPSNSPGCSISSTPVSALKQADWWLVGGFLAWLGGVRFRFKRRQARS